MSGNLSKLLDIEEYEEWINNINDDNEKDCMFDYGEISMLARVIEETGYDFENLKYTRALDKLAGRYAQALGERGLLK